MSVQDRLALLRNQLERLRETHVSQLLAVSQAALDEFDPSRRATFGTALKRSTQSTLDELRVHGQRVTGHVVTTAKQLFLPLDETTKAAILEIAKRLFDEELYTRRFDVQCQSLFRKAAGRGLSAEGWTRVDIERAGHHAATANTIRRELAMLSDELEFMRLQSEQAAQVSLSRLGDFSMLSLMHDTVDILKSNGTKIVGRKASVQQNKIFMDAKDLLIEPEDLIIRRMSNGAEETYKVIDPRFYERHGGIQAHYQMDVRKLGVPEASSAVQSIVSVRRSRLTTARCSSRRFGLPAMRQQFVNAAGRLRGQALEDVAQIGVGIVAIEPRRVHKAHDGRSPLAGTQAAGEQPVIAPDGDRPDLVLDPVVVDRQFTVVDVARQRRPAVQAVADGLGSGRSVGHLLAVLYQPLMQRICHRS